MGEPSNDVLDVDCIGFLQFDFTTLSLFETSASLSAVKSITPPIRGTKPIHRFWPKIAMSLRFEC